MNRNEKLIYKNEQGQQIEFSIWSPFFIEEVEGLSNIKNEVDFTKSVGQDGSTYVDSTYNSRNIILQGIITEYKDINRKRMLNTIKKTGTLYYKNKDITRVIKCVLENIVVNEKNKFQISLICPDPFWKDMAETETNLVSWIPNLEFAENDYIDEFHTEQNENSWLETQKINYRKNEVLGNIINTNAPCDGMMNVEIGGNTLQNLINIKELSNITVKSENSFEAMLWAGTLLENSQVLNIFKPNTTYTLKVKYILKTTSDLQVYSPRIGFNLYSPNTGSFEFGQTYTLVKVDDVEYINITFTTPNNLEDKKLIFYTKRFTNETKVELGTVLVEDLMILEGDWTNYNLSYFEGIKSVGELEGNKIEVLSSNNMVKNGNGEKGINYWTIRKGYEVNTIFNTFGKFQGRPWCGVEQTIFIKPNTNYTLTLNHSSNSTIYTIPSLLTLYANETTKTFNSGSNTKLTISIQNSTAKDEIVIFSNIKLEEGTISTPYEPYKEDKIDILNSLRGLPNGVRDVASGDTVTRKIGKRAYQTGDENNSKVITDKINTYYELKTPVIENLPKQLTLQSFENGSLVINTSIPPFIKEWHSINKDGYEFIEFQSEFGQGVGQEWGYRELKQIVEVDNKGDVECPIKVVFRASADVEKPYIQDVESYELIRINKTLKSGDVLEITTQYGNKNVFLNGKKAHQYLDFLNSTWLQLHSGVNLIKYGANKGLENLECTIFYTPLYLGV